MWNLSKLWFLYNRYCKRVFGFDEQDHRWDFLFSSAWYKSDNTPKGAAKRIRHMIKNGLPEGFIVTDGVYNYDKSLYDG